MRSRHVVPAEKMLTGPITEAAKPWRWVGLLALFYCLTAWAYSEHLWWCLVMEEADVQWHERELDHLFKRGDARGVVTYARKVLHDAPAGQSNSTAYGGIYKFLGAGLHSLGELEEATSAFRAATAIQAHDVQNWILLGDTLLHQLRAAEAARVYEEAIVVRRLSEDVSRLYKARQWTADWRDHDDLQARIRRQIDANIRAGRPPGVGSAEFTQVDAPTLLSICRHQPNADEATLASRLPSMERLPLDAAELASGAVRHRVGFLTSDLGVHPVSSLLRGFLTLLDRHRFHVHVYCLSRADSWWRRNISAGVESFHDLHGLSTEESAAVLFGHGLHTLIDLNGNTMHSGLPILALRPAPVQASFLGSPMTTGAAFVDWLVADPVVMEVAADARHQAEKLLLLPPSYLVNDHAQLMGHVITRPRRSRPAATGDGFVFGALSHFQKMDPQAFTIWCNVLRRVPGSRLEVMQYKQHESAGPNLLSEAMARGLYPSRLGFRPQEPWIDHVWSKTDVDVALDTLVKSGHTTDLDAMWAGVPLITMPGGRMENRAGASAYASMGWEGLVVYSAKEYEDLAVALATDRHTYRAVRREVEARRLEREGLFDTRAWTGSMSAALDAAWEVKAAVGQAWHVWTPPRPPPSRDREGRVEAIALGTAAEEEEEKTERKQGQAERRRGGKRRERAETSGAKGRGGQASEENREGGDGVLLLHIGGQVRRADWTVVDVQPGPVVDLVTPMDDLRGVGNSSVTAIYASHCLEHASYGLVEDRGLSRTLAEWHRVLKNGGLAMISVPDLAVLSRLFTNDTLSLPERFQVMRMMFGGQTDPHDLHRVGLDLDILTYFLEEAGFCEVRRVGEFGLFHDASTQLFLGQPISLNVMATACKGGAGQPRVVVSIG